MIKILATLLIAGSALGGGLTQLVNTNISKTNALRKTTPTRGVNDVPVDPSTIQDGYSMNGGSGRDRHYHANIGWHHVKDLYAALQAVPKGVAYKGACLYSFLTNNINWGYSAHWYYGTQFHYDLEHYNDGIDSFFTLLKGTNGNAIKPFDMNGLLHHLDHMNSTGVWYNVRFDGYTDYQWSAQNKYEMDYVTGDPGDNTNASQAQNVGDETETYKLRTSNPTPACDRSYIFTINAEHMANLYSLLQSVPKAIGNQGRSLFSFFTNNIDWSPIQYWAYGEQFNKDLGTWNDGVNSLLPMLKQANSHIEHGGFLFMKFRDTLNYMHALHDWHPIGFFMHCDYNGGGSNLYYMSFIMKP